MTALPVLCIGAAHWDIIARTGHALAPGDDVPGRIGRQPGGVALNIAAALSRTGQPVAIRALVGTDAAGRELVEALTRAGIDPAPLLRHGGRTDSYLAVESRDGEVFAAVADCAALERIGAAILDDLPPAALFVVDGNLPEAVLADPRLSGRPLAFVPASPSKAHRLRGAVARLGGTLYANLREAELILDTRFPDSADAAAALCAHGATRALVTDGPRPASLAGPDGTVTRTPPQVTPLSLTGAGDSLMAGHIAADLSGATAGTALESALAAAAAHISKLPEEIFS